MSDYLPMGTRVTFVQPLTRATAGHVGDGRYTKEWWGNPFTEPTEGIVVGVRTLSNGEIKWGWDDEPTTYTPKTRFAAYVVAFNLHKRPALVRVENVTPVRADA